MRSVTGGTALPRDLNKICDHPRRPCRPDDINDPRGRMNMEIRKNELMEHEKFEMPEMEIVNLSTEDVITASPCTAEDPCPDDHSEIRVSSCF